MKLLPSEQQRRLKEELPQIMQALYDDLYMVKLVQPCDCGLLIRHNNGGNYHSTILYKIKNDTCYGAVCLFRVGLLIKLYYRMKQLTT